MRRVFSQEGVAEKELRFQSGGKLVEGLRRCRTGASINF